ncbi:MAG TPA: ABC transporter substrate-binding protein [Chloroflexota bacterium]|nr:ABC transporter substrate-binding protein [Chloroflexota bacterium]
MRFVSIGIALIWLVAACAPASTTPSPAQPGATASAPIKLRIGTATTPPPALPESTLWLARDLGFYQKEGLDVEIVEAQATPSVIAALRSGEVDVGNINSEDVIRLTAGKDLEMRTINSSNGRNFFMIVGKSSIGSVKELSGKSYAIARVGSQDHALSTKVLAAKGVAADALSFVAVGQPNVRAQSLLAGQVDATTMSLATWVTVQNEKGLKVLVNADDYFAAVPLVNKGNAVSTKVLAEKPEALRRFTAAIIKASRFFAENKQGWVDGMTKLRPDIARADLEFLWDQFGASWAVNGQLNMSAYQTSTDFLYETGTFTDTARIDAKDWADTQFVDAVLKDVGVYPKVDDPGRPIK